MLSSSIADVVERAQFWNQHDPNPTTVRYVQDLLVKLCESQPSLAKHQQPPQQPEQQQEQEASMAELCRLFPPNNLRLQFGTAGLRARMQPGPLGMNDLVVIQTAQGLAKYVLEQPSQDDHNDNNHNYNNDNTSSNHPQHHKIRAIIGYDHRSSGRRRNGGNDDDHDDSSTVPFRVSSLSFAIYTALVFLEAGIDCFLLDGFVATPMVPFGVSRYLPALDDITTTTRTTCFGVMITASHNPAQDAGFKVYWTDGCQIRSPVDRGIAECIGQNLIPWVDYPQLYQDRQGQFPHPPPDLGLSRPEETQKLITAYYHAISHSGLFTGQAALATATTTTTTIPKFCYTAMHGVGHKFAQRAFETFCLPSFVSVPDQQEPDPTFPTVSFPNPEEKGALALAKEHATQNHCPIILANDPDADRLAVSEYNPDTQEWIDFTGDQIGVLLGHWLWTQFRHKDTVGMGVGTTTNDDDAARTKPPLPIISMCCSTVSSQMLATIARNEGFHLEDTLTGFKWIGSKAAALSKSGRYRQIFCYEEAIGYCCGDVIFDKDGISACAVFAELAIHTYCQQRQTLVQHLQALYGKYGEFVSNNGYYLLPPPSAATSVGGMEGVVAKIMDHITNHGKFDRRRVGKYEITSIRYLGEPGYDSTTKDGKPTLPTSASSPMVTIRFSNGGVAQFRGSGTEPKFKYYLELPGRPGIPRHVVEQECQEWSQLVLQELVRPEELHLRK